MEKSEIIEGNKLIAEFMYPDWKDPKSGEEPVGDYMKAVGGNHYVLACLVKKEYEMLRYNYSWDTLMPVVKKVSKHNPVKIKYLGEKMTTIIGLDGYTQVTEKGEGIISVYKAIVRFIKWHNGNKSN